MKSIIPSILFLVLSIANSIACNIEDIKKSIQYSDYKDAERKLNQCLATNPDDINLIKLASELYLKMDKMDLFQKYNEQLKSANAEDNGYLMRIAKTFFQRNKHKEVKQIGDRISPSLTSSEKKEFYRYYGQSLYHTNYFLEAIQVLEEYISSSPTDKDALMALSQSYEEIENYVKADEYMERALTHDTTLSKAASQKALGDAHYDSGKLLQAKAAYNQALEAGLEPDLNFWLNLAYLNYDLKDYQSALVVCDSVLASSPYNLNALNLKAYTYYNASKLKDARKVAEQILKIKKDDANTIYFIGMTYQKAEQMDKAEKYFERAIQINPALSKQRSEKMNWK